MNIVFAGIGKIARDQHLPQITRRVGTRLVASVSRQATIDGYPAFTNLTDALNAHPEIEAIAVCTPPQVRFAIAEQALQSNLHVLLEKPPCATLAEINALADLANQSKATLFASWHSRFASGVSPAKTWLSDKAITSARIVWKENIRKWHPGQDWILEAGGLGVFDPGINALSIATQILPVRFSVQTSDLLFPRNRAAPIAAHLTFKTTAGAPIDVEFDFREEGDERWEIEIETTQGTLRLYTGGAALEINGLDQPLLATNEYTGLYDRFINLIEQQQSDVDITPILHVADAFMIGRRHQLDAFHW